MTAQPSREELSDDELSQIVFYAGEAICHPDPNYALEFEKLSHPANVLALANEVIASRMLLAGMDSEPVVTDAMALAFHQAITDGSAGRDDIDEIKTGLRAALANYYEATEQEV